MEYFRASNGAEIFFCSRGSRGLRSSRIGFFLFVEQGGQTKEFVAILGGLQEIQPLGGLLHVVFSLAQARKI